MNRTILSLAVLIAASAHAQVEQSATCATGVATCAPSIKNAGDSTTTTTVLGDTQSQSAQNGVSSASNASGVNINPINTTKVQQDAAQNLSGNQSSNATGGAATGNFSSNDNKSSASTGASTSSTGPVSASTGPSTSSANGTNRMEASGNSANDNRVNSANASTVGVGVGVRGGDSAATGGAAAGGSAAGGSATGGAANGGATTSTMTGGANAARQGQTSANTNGVNSANRSGSDNAIRVDASDRSTTSNNYESKTIVHAPVFHGAGAAPLAVGNLAVVPGACGPRHVVYSKPVIGHRFGPMGGQSEIIQGETQWAQPAADMFLNVGGLLIGHIVIEKTGILGTSSASSFSLGGFSNNGGGGQGGAAASGQLQQIVTHYTLRDCVIQTAPVVVAAPTPAPAPASPAVLPRRADRN